MARGNVKNQKIGNLISDTTNTKLRENIVYLGTVVNIDDPLNAGRIKVRIDGVDKNESPIFCKDNSKNGGNNRKFYRKQGTDTTEIQDSVVVNNLSNNIDPSNIGKDTCVELPWSTPFLPKHLQIMPKVGELVKVIFLIKDKGHLDREWIGPVISEKDSFNYDYVTTASSTMNSGLIPARGVLSKDNVKSKSFNINKRGDFTGGLPEVLDISLISRNNADIVMPSFDTSGGNITDGGEVLIRAGKFKYNSNPKKNGLELNDENPAYFRLKVLKNNGKNKQPDTHAMLFADFISIISHRNGKDSQASGVSFINPIIEKDEDIKNIHNSLSPLIRGDKLLQFLELLRDYVANHDHPYAGLPATNANSKPEILKYDLNTLLSTNIRIN